MRTVLLIMALLCGCTHVTPASHGDDWGEDWDADTDQQQPDHNAAGGYIPACGQLPPMIGDDC
jgi:hypothetical protein